MEGVLVVGEVRGSAQKFYEQAKECLEQREALDFIEMVSKAEMASDVQDYLPQILFLKVKGLFRLKEYRKGLKVLPDAERYHTGEELVRLTNYKGVMLGYLGELEQARAYFKENLGQIHDCEVDIELLVETYLHLIWADLFSFKLEPNEEYLQEAETFLSLAREHFDEVKQRTKGQILDNLSVYYYYAGDLDRAIDTAEKVIPYFEEKDLPKVYNNLASMHLDFDEEFVDVLPAVDEYTQKAEVIATRYEDHAEIALAFYNKAMAELKADQLFTALDTLYLAFEFYKKAQALPGAFEVLLKINEIVSEYKLERMRSLKVILKEDFKDTSLYKKIN